MHIKKLASYAVLLIIAALSFTSTVTAETQNINPHNSADVEARVREYFADIPSMVAIARCESGFRQFGSDGMVLFDPSYRMIGVFQVSSLHLPHSVEMGNDIMTLEGNLAYARYLYNANGIDPWMSSFGCWGSAVKSAEVLGTSTPVSVLALSLGMSSPTVAAVQQLLNKAGYTVAQSGPGSVGNETTMFGSLTRAAVRRFQCAKAIACSGDESTTGYGMVDDKIYAALAAAQNTTPPTSTPATDPNEKAAKAAQIQAQINTLNSQIETLKVQLAELNR